MFLFHPHLAWLYLKMVKSFTCSKNHIEGRNADIISENLKKRITNTANFLLIFGKETLKFVFPFLDVKVILPEWAVTSY